MAKQRKWILWSALIALLVLCLTATLMYAFQAPIFDRSGWSQSENGLRYLDYYGRPQKGWQTIEGQQYYFASPGGVMCTGWQTIEKHTYYFGNDGMMRTGWLEADGQRYYLSDTGEMHTGWLETEEGRYYLSDTGVMHTGWLDTEEGRYYLSDTGIMHTGWLEADGQRYYLSDTGVMHTGWLDTEEGRYYLSDTGAMHTGWLDTEDARYYLSDTGIMHTGWLEAEGERYYLSDTGAMQTGWLEWEEDRYYLRDDGSMVKGRITVDGVNHFFTSAGKYLVVVNRWNPVPEDYDAELVKYNGFQVSQDCLDALKEMMADCKAAGHPCKINSAYRSKATQQKLWDKRYNGYISSGYTKTKAKQLVQSSVAQPGTSEHQLGLAIDFGGGQGVYNWLAKNSWKYGFHLRYPEGETDVTGIIHEPWHFRYLGKELAKELYDMDLTVEAYMDQLTRE